MGLVAMHVLANNPSVSSASNTSTEIFVEFLRVLEKILLVMSQRKTDLWGDFLSQGVFTLLLACFCGAKKVKDV